MGWFSKKSQPADFGKLTPKKLVAYKTLMSVQSLTPEEIVKGAEAFEKAGHPELGRMLRKRAELKSAPKDIRDQRKAILRDLFKSQDPDEVEEGAAAFDKVGASISADQLRSYAKGLRLKNQAKGQ
jgi:hypothetical protein